MNKIDVVEIAIRLLFAFILGGAIAIETRWYLTQKSIRLTTQMATATAMLAILLSLAAENK